MPARNTLVQLLALYTNPATVHSVTDRQTDRQTDSLRDNANSRSYCLAARSAKHECKKQLDKQ